MVQQCTVEMCKNPIAGKGLCRKHYMQQWRTGSIQTGIKAPCIIGDCNRIAVARGMCSSHWSRWYEGDREERLARPFRIKQYKDICGVGGCQRPAKSSGMCISHWTRWSKGERGARLERSLRVHTGFVRKGQKCVVKGCHEQAKSRRMCPMHYTRWQKTGDPGEAKRRNAPKGKRRWVDENGYIHVSRGHLGIMEHRAVMEKRLGRALLPHETVHHRNRVRSDNRDKNLELWSSKHPKGARIEDLVEYAHEILLLYEGLIEVP